jgi:hypothetical protein
MISSKVKGSPSSLTMSARAFCDILLAVSKKEMRNTDTARTTAQMFRPEPGIADLVGLIFRSLSVMTRVGSAFPARSTSFEGFILTPLSSG